MRAVGIISTIINKKKRHGYYNRYYVFGYFSCEKTPWYVKNTFLFSWIRGIFMYRLTNSSRLPRELRVPRPRTAGATMHAAATTVATAVRSQYQYIKGRIKAKRRPWRHWSVSVWLWGVKLNIDIYIYTNCV